MLYAYCDESYSSDIRTTPVYVVAGFLGDAYHWASFHELWRDTMRELGIEGIGCHAAKCANGAGPYKLMTGEERASIQYRLIVDITASKLFGVVSAIDMDAYREVRSRLTACLSPADRQYNEPHVLAIRQCVYQMCQETEHATDEPIRFVADRNDAFGKRAKAFYNIAANNPDNKYRKRFGKFEESERMLTTGLQAADLLAYSGFRQFSPKESWTWGKLRQGVEIAELTTDRSFWQRLAKGFEAKGQELISS